MTDSRREKDWKRKYLDSLEEHEKKERAWEDKERELRRSISRLSFLGDGLDPALDDRLEQLRNQVRSEKDVARLQRLIDGITRAAEGLDAKNRQAGASSTDLAAYLRQVIESVSIPAPLAGKAKQLGRELDRGPLSAGHLDRLKALLAGLVAEQTGDGSRAQTAEPQGPLSRLFRKAPGDDEAAAEGDADGEGSGAGLRSEAAGLETVAQLLHLFFDQLKAIAPPVSEYEPLLARLRLLESRQEIENLLGDLARVLDVERNPGADARDLLLQLLEKLDFPPGVTTEVEGLKTRLRQGMTPNQQAGVVETLVGLLARIRDMAEHERQDVEGFLRQLTSRLKELDAQLGGADVQGRAILEHNRQLGSLVQDEMSGIRDSVESADDLSELKLDITQRLQRIQHQLERHRADDERRSQEFENCISGLRERLSQVELEADGLKKKVEETRAEAFTDALTGINNRLAFDARMKQEYSRWRRYGAPLSLVMLDLDRFKQINDTFGHKAGDKVLQVMGKLLRSQIRDVDCAARYGGEEFVLLLPETDLAAATTVAEKIRREVEKTGFHSRERKVGVTLSGGIAVFGGEDTPESVFERADAALYAAKNGGRNQCRPQS